jgi:methylated-DNA-[protein]-cysteine S-methyltransferase
MVPMAVTQVAYEVEGWGVGELWLDDGTVVWHELPHPARRGSTLGTNALVERLQAYFEGEDVSFDDVPVDLEHETPFLERCARALREIPRGEVVTYGELAARSARPGAARAVGMVMNRNPLPIVLPCHRVIGANGKLTGYAGGLDRKETLLRLEGAIL